MADYYDKVLGKSPVIPSKPFQNGQTNPGAIGFDNPRDNVADVIVAKQMIVGDNTSGVKPKVPNVIFGTGAAPAANTVPIGTIFIKYT